jgi:hypothetical protein
MSGLMLEKQLIIAIQKSETYKNAQNNVQT